ncbi:MAG: restriction endonuclease subunit S [Prosthecobacter sp.]
MKLETFFEKFVLFADAPDAVSKMRELVLHLAVAGRLVAQEPSDEPAEVFLKRTGLKSTFSLDAADNSLPSSWIRVRFEDIAITAGGVTLGRKLGDRKTVTLPYLRVANVKRGEIDLGVIKEVTIADEEIERYALRENDLLMTEGGDWDKVGRAAIWKGEIPICLHQNHVFRSRMRSSEILPVWFEHYFNSPKGRRYFESAAKQTTNLASINMRQVRACPVPLPPLAEQERIAAKVDELMALCDRLEAQQQERETRHAALARASLARFADAPTPANLHFLFHPSYAIPPAVLRKSILTLAFSGKLVPQDPEDETAEELLWKILGERERLVKARRIRRLKLPPVTEEDEPFPIPQTWIWTRLGTIGDWGSGSTPPRGNHELYGGTITWLKSGELNDNQALVGSSETVTELALKSCSFRQNSPGDVLIAMYGATIGKLAILAEHAVTNQAVCGCTPFAGVLNTFLFNYLRSRRDAFHAASEGGAQPNISKLKIVNFPFPLPPLLEQRRIVAKLEHLMALVGMLETQLDASRATAANLLSAIVAEISR